MRPYRYVRGRQCEPARRRSTGYPLSDGTTSGHRPLNLGPAANRSHDACSGTGPCCGKHIQIGRPYQVGRRASQKEFSDGHLVVPGKAVLPARSPPPPEPIIPKPPQRPPDPLPRRGTMNVQPEQCVPQLLALDPHLALQHVNTTQELVNLAARHCIYYRHTRSTMHSPGAKYTILAVMTTPSICTTSSVPVGALAISSISPAVAVSKHNSDPIVAQFHASW